MSAPASFGDLRPARSELALAPGFWSEPQAFASVRPPVAAGPGPPASTRVIREGHVAGWQAKPPGSIRKINVTIGRQV